MGIFLAIISALMTSTPALASALEAAVLKFRQSLLALAQPLICSLFLWCPQCGDLGGTHLEWFSGLHDLGEVRSNCILRP
jgi:cyanate permease